MASATAEKKAPVQRRFVSESEVERFSGRSRRTLQKDRLFGRIIFPHYKVGGRIVYDLNEVEAIILDRRVA